MKPVVFIQSNEGQMLCAKLSEYSLKKASADPGAFETRILAVEDYPFLLRHEGKPYRRGGEIVRWKKKEYSQSFVPLRFLPPQLMNYAGRALVIDPDIFAVGDVRELLEQDMAGNAIVCRKFQSDKKPSRALYYASSVMLLDCAKLPHWRLEAQIEELFAMKRNYRSWVNLTLEPEGIIGPLAEEWNHLDTLTEKTKLLHFTRRSTQPWMTGLPYDRVDRQKRKIKGVIPEHWPAGLRSLLRGEGWRPYGAYLPNPNPPQTNFFFSLLRDGLEKGVVTEAFVRSEIQKKHVRPDLFEALEAVPKEAVR